MALSGLAVRMAWAQQQPTAPPAPAPTQAPPSPSPADEFEGRAIREIRILKPVEGKPGELAPVGAAIEQLVRNQLRTLEGRPFLRQTVTEDVSRLTRLGRFHTIRSEVQPLQDGSVTLTYILEEQPVIQDVQVVGNRELADQDLLGAVGVLTGTPVDPFQIDRAARSIEDLYRTKGYYRARVQVDEKELAESSIVVFRVVEGERVRVMDVRFEGNNAFRDRDLYNTVRTTEYFPIFESGPVDDNVLAEDAGLLVRFYRDRGYLDARTSWRVQPSPDGREAIVTFVVEEGPLYTLRSVEVLYRGAEPIALHREEVLKNPAAQVEHLTPAQMLALGYRPLSQEQVLGLMLIKPGDVYSDDKIRKSLDAIRVGYAKLGYVRDTARGPVSVQLDPREVRDEARPLVDLILFIEEGEPWKTGEVVITGNEHTKQEVILHELEIRPGRPLDLQLMEESRKNLEQRKLFALQSVRITPQPPTEDEEHRDVLVEVQETTTGSINIGAAVGSDSGVVGRFAIVERNFDLFDVPDSWGELFSGRAFRGGGQTSDLEIQPGAEVQTYSYTLTDPTLFDTDYTGSGTALYRQREYRQYDEERYGGRFSLGRRFGRVWTGALSFRNEWVSLSNIDEDAPVDVYEVEDLNRLDLVGIELLRTTVDDRIRPSRGARMGFSAEQAGVAGGDFDFTRFGTEYAGFFTVYESFLGYKTILKLSNQIGYIPQDQDDVPVYERFYLGGQSFRGFTFRTVSPKGIRNDNGEQGDDPVGGTFSFFLGAELQQPIFKDTVALALFLDTGTVDTEISLDEYRVSAGFGVRLLIPQLSQVPLAFDFGFPIVRQRGDQERIFSFSIDLPFQ